MNGVIRGFALALERNQTQIDSLQNDLKAMKMENWPGEAEESDRGI